MYETVKGYHM